MSSSFGLFSRSRYIFGNDGEMSVKLTFPDKILKRSGLLVCYQYLILQVIHTRVRSPRQRARRCLQSDLPGKPWSLNNTADTDHVVVKVFHSAGSTHCWLNWGKNSLLIFNSGCCMNLTTFVCFFSITSYFDFNS